MRKRIAYCGPLCATGAKLWRFFIGRRRLVSCQLVADDAVGDLAKAAHRAGGHDHSNGPEIPTRHRTGGIVDWKCHIREPPYVPDLPICIVRRSASRHVCGDAVGFLRQPFECLEALDARDRAQAAETWQSNDSFRPMFPSYSQVQKITALEPIQRDLLSARSQSRSSTTSSEVAYEHRGPHRSVEGQARFA